MQKKIKKNKNKVGIEGMLWVDKKVLMIWSHPNKDYCLKIFKTKT